MPQAAIYDPIRTKSGPLTALFFDRSEKLLPNQGSRNAKLKDKILGILDGRSDSVVIDSISRVNLYQGECIVESSIPSFPPIITEFKVKNLPSNKPYDKRRRAGEVVLSTAEHGSLSVKSYPGLSTENYVGPLSGKQIDQVFLTRYLGFRTEVIKGTTYLVDPGEQTVLISFGGFNVAYKLWASVAALPPIPLTAETVYAMVRNTNEVDTDFVTSMVADANKRLLDVLTTLAETPESVRSLATLLGTVKNIVVGVKRRQFSLTQSFADRKTYLTRKRNEDLFKLDIMREDLASEVSARKLSRRISNRRKRQFDRDQERIVKTYERAMKKSGIEFVDAMASTWMNFRYNIMPLVYTAIDITEAITKNPEFLTTRDGKEINHSIVLHSGLPALDYACIFNVFIRDRARPDVGPFSLTSKVVSANILTTAWELVPLSFVVDWFINVGDWVSAISGGSTADRSSTVSFKTVLDYSAKDSSNRRVIISGQLWNREVTGSLQQYTCLSFEPDMNPKRYTDSVALLWNAARENLKRSIR